ncbi:MAG: hypothetical protein Q7V43_31060 [Myxococcales bacterium]|nr:hypothetical protein [Myxococcales bacterium]
MRRGTWLQACIGVSALVYASGAAAQGRGPGPFAGSFSVASNTTVSVTSPMAITEERTTRERLEISQGSRTDLSVRVTNDLGEHCTLTANRSGDSSLSFGSGQRCTFTDSVRNMRMNFTLRSGSGSISGERLSLSFSWSVASNGGFLSVSGSASQRSSGNRTGGSAMADTAAPVEVAAPIAVVAPSFPAAVEPVAEPVVAPMMPMSGTPARSTSTRRPSTTASRPRTPAPVVAVVPTPVVTPTPTPASAPASAWGSPSPTAATTGAPASAWGSPSPTAATTGAPASAWGSPSPSSAPAASSWTTPTVASGAWGAPATGGAAWGTPIDANTPGAVVLPSGWILGPLVSSLASAAPVANQAVSAWTTPQASSPSSVGQSWGSPSPSQGGAWTPSAGGPGVVLGAPGAAPSQGFGVTVGPSPSAPGNPQSLRPAGSGPGLVFGASH